MNVFTAIITWMKNQKMSFNHRDFVSTRYQENNAFSPVVGAQSALCKLLFTWLYSMSIHQMQYWNIISNCCRIINEVLQISCKVWRLRKIQKGFHPSVKGALLMTHHIQWTFECIHCMCGHACHYVCANDPQGLLLSFDHLVPRIQIQVIGFGSGCSYPLTRQSAVKETF